ncbi:uncharacterized protein LOC122510656 isoform X2 [Leptopilina heterotoma]|uniref:uncharacterized protein LOC122510656 isoform X2 n=1 Tax=Leptopilina heterotoma TaxID=63436 RepID=UPI001CA90C58|nr:uncharacterized protein LOC122510656 isoform X2 [Leptopilina heterotoma]
MMINEKHTFGYSCVSSIIAIFILIYSSSPKLMLNFAYDKNFVDTIKDDGLEPNRHYSPHVKHLFLFIVDGFETDDLNDTNLPYITELVKNGTGCFSNYKQQPFSTATQKTMTLITGQPTGVLHEIFTNNEFSAENNFHSLFKENGFKIFFANYDNIEKSRFIEFYQNRQSSTKIDLDWLVFHLQAPKYTGSPRLNTKLQNLRYFDALIKSLHAACPYNSNYKILIMGYSGTRILQNDFKKNKNLGPLVIIQNQHCEMQNTGKYLEEFDLTPLISVWTHLPIPSSSYGTIDENFLFDYTLSEKIFAFYYNTQKLYYDLRNLNATVYIDSLIPIFRKTVNNHREYLQNGEKNEIAAETILKVYENLMNSFSKIIHDLRIQQNATLQFLAFILLIEALVIILNTSCTSTKNLKTFTSTFGIHVIILVFVLSMGTLRRVTSFISMTKEEAIILTIIATIMFCNSVILVQQENFLSTFFSVL